MSINFNFNLNDVQVNVVEFFLKNVYNMNLVYSEKLNVYFNCETI